MVKFVEVNPADINTDRLGRRGRVSYPLLKAFLEANIKVGKLDLTGVSQNPNYLRSVLHSYIKSHKLPVKLFSAAGDLHLMRLDLDNDGKPIEGYSFQEAATEGAGGLLRNEEPMPINDIEVEKRFQQERTQITK